MKNIKIKVIQQGAPIVNTGWVVESGKNIVALYVDLKSKYCEVSSSFSGSNGDCGVSLKATERSLHLNEEVEKEDFTSIVFSDYKGWDVFAYYLGRYTLNVCLVKPKQND